MLTGARGKAVLTKIKASAPKRKPPTKTLLQPSPAQKPLKPASFIPRSRAPPVPTVVYQDRAVMVLNKPAGLISQAAKEEYGLGIYSMGSWIDAYCDKFSPSEKPKTVHRLDKATSGAFILAKTIHAGHDLSRQFQQRTVGKTYLAVVAGVPSTRSGRMSSRLTVDDDGRPVEVNVKPTLKDATHEDEDLEGRLAEADWEVLASSKNLLDHGVSLLRLQLLTGHKHQLRIQLASILKTPVFGDRLYGGSHLASLEPGSLPAALRNHLFLHASSLALDRYAKTGRKIRLHVSVPPPRYFVHLCDAADIKHALTYVERYGGLSLGGIDIDFSDDARKKEVAETLGGVWMPDMDVKVKQPKRSTNKYDSSVLDG
ncbi:pseudouridine synthase [Auriculariales sp. MPI-PUGE-AT-0066]|nr:pseudouridine synthase [Auriculariales sp. MPI-PUGE-AT-0066]